MSKGLSLSHDHKVVFSKRSPCHRKIFDFLLALVERQTKREHALQEMFVLQDTDGSGKISARELQKAFVAKAATLEEELTMLEAEEILNVVDVNGDNEIKREEFVDFFLDGLAHAEADDKEWNKGFKQKTHDKVIAIMNRIIEELDDGLGQELSNAADEWASFMIDEPMDDDEDLSSFTLANSENNVDKKSTELRQSEGTSTSIIKPNKNTEEDNQTFIDKEEDKQSNASFDFSDDDSENGNEDNLKGKGVEDSIVNKIKLNNIKAELNGTEENINSIDELSQIRKSSNNIIHGLTSEDNNPEVIIGDSESDDDIVISDSD